MTSFQCELFHRSSTASLSITWQVRMRFNATQIKDHRALVRSISLVHSCKVINVYSQYHIWCWAIESFVGLQDDIEKFGIFTLNVVTTTVCAAGLGFFYSSLVNVFTIAQLMLSLTYVIMLVSRLSLLCWWVDASRCSLTSPTRISLRCESLLSW